LAAQPEIFAMRILTFALLASLLALPAVAAQPDYLDDRSTPQAVISSFYNAINRQEYARAWSYYQDGQGVPKFAAFVKGYQDTASVRVGFGQPAQEGAAGSTYWTLPVSLDAVDRAGRHGYFSGCYTLRLANPAIQGAPPFRPLHIVEGHLSKAKGAGPSFAPAKCTP
jgi:hypothetical protein